MDRNKNLEQYKRIIRAVAALIVIICTVLIFLAIWRGYYNIRVVFPFYYKGHWMIAAVYMIFVILFMYIYGGLKFGYLKCSSIILSQVLAVICANVMAYLEIVLLAAKFVSIVPIFYMTLIDIMVIVILTNAISFIFKKLFPPDVYKRQKHRLLSDSVSVADFWDCSTWKSFRSDLKENISLTSSQPHRV